jgi:DNA-binding NtrC family response regulator
MVERIMLPPELMLETPLTRRASPHGNDNAVSRKLQDGGVSLKEIARTAAQAVESGVILLALQQTHWNRVRAAQLLNISYRTLLYKIKGLGLHPAARSAQRRPGRLGSGEDPKA